MMKKKNYILFGALGLCSGFILGLTISKNRNLLSKNDKKKEEKFRSYYNLLNNWVILKQSGQSIETYFIQNHINKIAIYGMGELGNRLYEDLKNSSINVVYAIDKNPGYTYSELPVYSIDDDWEVVDAIIVTAISDFESIETALKEKTDFRIISLEDVITYV